MAFSLNRYALIALIAAASVATVIAVTSAKATPAVATALQSSNIPESELPKALNPLASQGVSFVGTFGAPGELTGYVGSYQGQGLVVYVTPDGEHAIVGNMIDEQGRDIGASYIQRMHDAPRQSQAWEKVEGANWFIEGDENAPNVLYTFTDPFCPYCRRLHESVKPYVEEGRLQVRHIMVGIIREASPAIASSILGSEDPYQMFLEHMNTFDDGGIVMDGNAMRRAQSDLRENQAIMREMGLSSTPVSYYKDSDGNVQMLQGAPRSREQIEQMLVN